MTERLNISSGAPWEDIAGYSRAVKLGNLIFIAGTAAVDENGDLVGAGDPYEQARFILGKIERALVAAGSGLQDVVRTVMYVTDISQWEEISRAHGEVFRDIRPAATMVEVRSLILPEMLVEIEATAVIELASQASGK
jgi:enamine deaminase RidA (YjgF/YER057c/UK114 family)